MTKFAAVSTATSVPISAQAIETEECGPIEALYREHKARQDMIHEKYSASGDDMSDADCDWIFEPCEIAADIRAVRDREWAAKTLLAIIGNCDGFSPRVAQSLIEDARTRLGMTATATTPPSSADQR